MVFKISLTFAMTDNSLTRCEFWLCNGNSLHIDHHYFSFLELLDDDLDVILPSYTKGGPWLQLVSHSNSLCARATRAITNHVPIGEYRLCFFPNEEFSCPCNEYPIESRRHILYDCKRFNGYWNPRRDTLKHFVMFLRANLSAFTFNDSPVSI